MRRRLTASALFALGLVALTAAARQPAADPKAKSPAKKDEKKADPLDALIGAALAHDADVQVARAKVQLAEAELTKARQGVTLKVVTLRAAVEDQKRVVASAEQAYLLIQAQFQRATTSSAEVMPVRDRYEAAKAKLSMLETELKLLTGGGPAPADRGANDPAVEKGLAWLTRQQGAGGANDSGHSQTAAAYLAALMRQESVKGPMADRIRAALDKPVKLGAKDEEVTFDQALEVFKKEAGLDVPVRVRFAVKPITSLGEELPVGAWLQLFADGNHETRIVVREYGLLWTGTGVAPPDAVSVFDFWKQKSEKKAEEPKKPAP